MKFLNYSALQKHVRDSLSLHQCPHTFLVVQSQRQERRKSLEKIVSDLQSANVEAQLTFFEAEESPWSKVYDALMTPSLFGEKQIVVWNGIKALEPQTLEAICSYVLHPSPDVFFLMGAEASKPFGDLYQSSKQELVLLDFSEEKPWNKQKRVVQEMMQLIRSEGKTISHDLMTRLAENSGYDPLILESEALKLITYVGERSEIVEQDFIDVASSSSQSTGWELTEALVWGEAKTLPESAIDLTFLLSWMGQLRYSLNQARQIGWCMQAKMTPDEIVKKLYPLKKPQLQKIAQKLRTREMRYFDEALFTLYELELLAKNSHLSPSNLFHHVQLKLTHLKTLRTR